LKVNNACSETHLRQTRTNILGYSLLICSNFKRKNMDNHNRNACMIYVFLCKRLTLS